METTRTHGRLDSGAALLERTLAAALVAAVILNVVNVVSRYVFGDVISFADELQIYLMVALAFMGSVVASARRMHLRMDVLTRSFPQAMRRLFNGLEAIAAVGLCGLVTWVSSQYTVRMYEIGSHSENAHVPMWIPHGVVAVAFAFMTLIGVLRIGSRGPAPTTEAVIEEVLS